MFLDFIAMDHAYKLWAANNKILRIAKNVKKYLGRMVSIYC